MEAIIESFRSKMMDLARRSARGDENIALCLIGYVSANPSIANELYDLYKDCEEKVAKERMAA